LNGKEAIDVSGYLIRRFFLMLVTLFGISVLIFVMLRLVPGNITDIIFDSAGFVNPVAKKKIEQQLGLDQPIITQYVTWINGLAHGDLGYAYVSEKPAIQEIAPRIPITAKLAGLALTFAILFGVPLGVISAVKQNSGLDYVLRVISLSGLSMPAFWLGLLTLMAFVKFFGTIPIYSNAPGGFWNALGLYSIPAVVVGFRSSALVMRLTRSSMLEVLDSRFVLAARARGLPERRVLWRHALPNALLPAITVLAIDAGLLIGGIVVVETVFAYPGLGRLLVFSIQSRDIPTLQAAILVVAAVFALANLAADLIYAWLNPGLRHGRNVA